MDQFKLVPEGLDVVPLCVDCRHYSETAFPNFGPRCTSNKVIEISPVTGAYSMDSPYEQRELKTQIAYVGLLRKATLVPADRHCGPDGRFFEPEEDSHPNGDNIVLGGGYE